MTNYPIDDDFRYSRPLPAADAERRPLPAVRGGQTWELKSLELAAKENGEVLCTSVSAGTYFVVLGAATTE